MNQILVTGYEGEKKVRKEKKPRGEKKVIGIKPIVIFYAIFTIILGVCMVSGSAYAMVKINETVEANAKPVLEVNRNDDNNTIDIQVSHIRGIETIKYKWNDENEKTITANGQKQIKETIPLKGGENTLTVSVTEQNGETVSYKNTYTANIPTIDLTPVSNGVKIVSTSEEGIDYIAYSWDEGEKETIKVNDEQYDGIINAPEGKHILYIESVDQRGEKAILEQLIVGDKAPTITIKAALIDGKKSFVVDVEDDTEISTVEITLNGEVLETVEVGETTYHKEIEILQGENKLKIKAININNLELQKGAKFINE